MVKPRREPPMPFEAPPHIRLLNLLGAIRDLSPFDLMTAEEEQLLSSLLVRWHEAKDTSVSEIMASVTGVSATTAYRRLIGLRDKGLVQLRVDAEDKRVKFVDPTRLAEEYGRQVNLAVNQLMGGSEPA